MSSKRYCHETGKLKLTEAVAKASIGVNIKGAPKSRSVHHYHCKACNTWHVTSQKQ